MSMLKRFRNQKTYYIIYSCSFVFVLILSAIFTYLFLLALFRLAPSLGLSRINYVEALIPLPFVLTVIFAALHATKVSRYNYMLSRFIKAKNSTHAELDLIPDEKVMIEQKLCVIKTISVASQGIIVRNVVVTNFRITIGFLNSLTLFTKSVEDEKLSLVNIWHPNAENISQKNPDKDLIDSLAKILGADSKIIDIAYGTDNFGEYVMVRIDLYLSYWKIYHPQANHIYAIFSKNN
jgi:hypothetical protein